jgi:hypothetical protein
VDIQNTDDLSKIIDLCRKKGVETIQIGNVQLTLREEAPASRYKKKQIETTDKIDAESLYDEEASLYWSSAGIPEEKDLNG